MLEIFGVIVVSVITAVIGPSVVEVVKNKLKKDEFKDPIVDEVEQSSVILDELDSIMSELGSDRVWIQMYHNGGHFLITNRSIQKFSIMYEVSSPGVSSIGHIFSNLPISLYSRATEQLLSEGHIYIEDYSDPKVATYGLKSAGETTGTKSSYAVGLFDIKTNKCIGSLGCDYLKKKSLRNKDLQFLNERSQRVAGYLSTLLK